MDGDDRSALEAVRGSRVLAYSMGLITLLAGIVLLAWPDRTVTVVARLAGVLIAIVGVAEAFDALSTHRKGDYWGFLLLRGLFNLVFGGLLLFWPDITVTVLVWLFGLDLLITGIIGLFVFRRVPDELGRSSLMTQSFVGLVIGIALIVWPSATVSIVAFLVGALLILFGLLLLWSGWTLSRATHAAA